MQAHTLLVNLGMETVAITVFVYNFWVGLFTCLLGLFTNFLFEPYIYFTSF